MPEPMIEKKTIIVSQVHRDMPEPMIEKKIFFFFKSKINIFINKKC
jgi:hypothetical protein